MFIDTPQYKEVHFTKYNIVEIEKLKKLRKSSHKKIWWICDNSSCVHEWEARIFTRTGKQQSGCPICANREICPCENKCNSFGSKYPDIASEWDFTENEKTPNDYTPRSNIKVQWRCSKSQCVHEWKTTINSRTSKKTGCPFCAGRDICPCENKCNSFGYKYPEIASEWHITRNGKNTPYDYAPGCNEKVWWKCSESQCGKHEWEAYINSRTSQNSGCPFCANKKICPCENKCNSFGSLYPEIASEWHITGNGKNTPYDYTPGSDKKVWWKCSESQCGKHIWKAYIYSRTIQNSRCQYCVGSAICPCENKCNSFGSLYPKIASEWHIKNEKTPYDFAPKSREKVWWKCSLNHEWEARIDSRTSQNSGCPKCNESKGEKLVAKILESWNITYNIQEKFEKCKYNRKLKFDFYIPSLNTCIEYDGEQHFIYINYFHKNKEGFHRQKRKDDIKSIYCQTNNIKLLRVNYMQTESEINNCIRRLILFGIYNVF